MKSLYDLTLSEVNALIGDTPDFCRVLVEVVDAQAKIKSTNAKELADKIDAAKAKLAKPPKPEILFLSEKDFLNASKG
jgi:RNA processing factor Prp31